ncbi:hypothetical protein [Streptomyces brasiliensis]|uniref:Uncharacterized protein n=1 Tax=Streptomyces brasiliensis TaxID=1954 RepID=A0A917KKW3_9ACTN|nr:hypothetical protein [Streptomyces brasiliensis]GGJ16177.1 hypothetical protein GCM10010121_028550 [Streptomyces brasiliensis]
MLGRTSARYGRPTERYARGLTAAVVTVVALITAANAGPARAAQEEPAPQVTRHAQHHPQPPSGHLR